MCEEACCLSLSPAGLRRRSTSHCDEPSSDETRRRFFFYSLFSLILGQEGPGNDGQEEEDCRPVIRASAMGVCCSWRR